MSLICYEFTIFVVTNMSLICTAGTLNPRGHYVSGVSIGQLNALRTAFERMTALDTTTVALSEAQTFCVKTGSFSSPLAHKMAVDGKTSSGMHLFQLHFIAADVLTSKLMMCSYHFQLHGGKCSITQHLHFRSLQCDLSLNVHQRLDASGIEAYLHSSILRSAIA
jgi:hypothetical protein